MTTAAAPSRAAVPEAAPQRFLALDSMRGLVMLVLCSQGLGIGALGADARFRGLARQFDHLPWAGFVAWEMIMPSFMFMIGAALPFAIARRRERGATRAGEIRHVAARTLKLIALGQILTCLYAGRYAYEPYETLTQLGLSYFTCYFILLLPRAGQIAAAAALMAVNSGLYVLFPGQAGPFSPDDNIGVVIDRAVFGLVRKSDWATMNFLGSSVSMLFGAWAAFLLLSKRTAAAKIKTLALASAASFAAAALVAPFDPVIHKAWTASFTFLHTGILLAVVLLLFVVVEVCEFRSAAFPLAVVGMNSIFIYLMNQSLRGWIDKSLGIFTLRFGFLGPIAPAVQACAVAAVMWSACYWLYRRKIFFKL